MSKPSEAYEGKSEGEMKQKAQKKAIERKKIAPSLTVYFFDNQR
jgi:hypothetical protein